MKRKLFVGVLSVMIALLCACGKEEDRGGIVTVEKIEPTAIPADNQRDESLPDVAADTEEAVTSETDNPQTDAGSKKEPPVSEKLAVAYPESYAQIVKEKEGNAFTFSLIYLDGDDIPELVICDRGYGTYSVYTAKNGEAFCMIDSMTTVEMAYFERSGMIAQFERWNGGGEEGGYGWYYYQVSRDRTLADGDLPTLNYRYDAVYDEEGNWTEKGITKYYYMGQEIDEKSFQQKMNDLGIIEGNEKFCADGSLEKEKMMEALSKGESSTPQTDRAQDAYYSALDRIYKTHRLPDGTDLGYDEISPLSDNQFAVYDIDKDGQDELIVVWTTTYTAGMSEIVYGFDGASGAVRAELWEFPMPTFYDNGAVEAGLSHDHGLSGAMNFWPYTLYQYDKNTDSYALAASVDAWNKAYYEKDYDGRTFPDDVDADGDGVIYLITKGDDEKLMDLDAYEKWRASFIGGAERMEIPFRKMTEIDAYFSR